MSEDNKTTWVDVQKRAFTRWANGFLSERMMDIKDIEKDLASGVFLINLLEIISSKSIGVPAKNPKSKFQKVENLNQALRFISNEGVKLVGIGAEDIHDGKLKLILGMIWTLILRFQINLGEGSPKWELLQWVRQQVKPYTVDEPNNFTKDWMNGKVLYALVDSLQNGILTPKDLSAMTGNPNDDVEKAMQTALDAYGIPRILDVSDMTENPDELAMMTYVSYFREFMSEDSRRKREEHLRKLREADAANCFADGPGLTKADTYQPSHFAIHARNCFGNPLDPLHGGDKFVVEIVRDGTKVDVDVKDSGNGDYPATYTATVPGSYNLRITLNGQDIKDSPFKLSVLGPDSTKTRVSGSGVEGARINQPADILIEGIDQDGNPVKSGGDPYKIKVSGPESVGAVEVKDNGNGKFTASYQVATPGHYKVEVTVRGEQVAKSPYDVLIQNGNAGNSYADGPGLEGGKTDHDLEFTIHAVDADGKPATIGGDPFEVTITGPETLTADVKDNGDGTYSVTYNPDKPGDYKINATLHGENIKNLPTTAHVKTSPSAGNSYAEGPGLEAGQAEKDGVFTIHAVDKNGQPLAAGGDDDEFAVKITGPNGEVDAKVTDNGDGTYGVVYKPDDAGDFSINVTFGDAPIKDMPVTVSIKAAPCAPKSYAEGPGLLEAEDNGPGEFRVFLLDKNGVQRVDGGDNLQVAFEGVAPVTHEIKDNNDGTYDVTYYATEPGEYKISVTVDDEHIRDSPFTTPIKEGTDPELSGFGAFTFTVQAYDRRGNKKTFGGDKFEVKVANKQDPEAQSDAEGIDNGDGTYTAKYELEGKGTFMIDISINGKKLKVSPLKQKL